MYDRGAMSPTSKRLLQAYRKPIIEHSKVFARFLAHSLFLAAVLVCAAALHWLVASVHADEVTLWVLKAAGVLGVVLAVIRSFRVPKAKRTKT
jgi:uncharacterized membrane protein HdeD (DUF308 family)